MFYLRKRYGTICGVGNSYVQVVKGNNTSVVAESDHTPTLVLDDECLNTSDLSNSLMGRVKEFASLSNLKMASKKLFHSNVGIGSWFSQLIQASKDFTIEGRIVWVEIEGDSSGLNGNGLASKEKVALVFQVLYALNRGLMFRMRGEVLLLKEYDLYGRGLSRRSMEKMGKWGSK
ncbi:hypothetical protein Tco_0703046 [Tanacetum coccineum]|uniref:Uncharacterized protein n=1 Tax=Tanacetum coccineum TaxID=301880 RepID=A0ABQ4XYQ2_9ASTR